jgi:glycosyltransferase involved in cell wall biosynthesis
VRYSIITPTICRRTLVRLCESINRQIDSDWEHLVQVDTPLADLSQGDIELLKSVEHPQRKIEFCEKRHGGFGNVCRGISFRRAVGDYILYIDDDDYYADNEVLTTLRGVTAGWSHHPSFSAGQRVYKNPPELGYTGSAMFMHRRDLGITFEPIDKYSADGQLVETLKKKCPVWDALDIRPLVVYERANCGKTQHEIDVPRYSIVTPTLCRSTLKRLCDSIDTQTNTSREHIVVVDKPEEKLTDADRCLLDSISRPLTGRRYIHFCSRKNHPVDFGNFARREAYGYATGEYMCQIDDDDYYADNEVLKTLEAVTEVWAIYPVLARGKREHRDPPGIGLTGSAMFIYRRDTGIKFPDNTDYSADGQVVEALKKKYPYQALSRVRPLVIYPWANHGMSQEEIAERFANRPQRIQYAKDGLTIDWNNRG